MEAPTGISGGGCYPAPRRRDISVPRARVNPALTLFRDSEGAVNWEDAVRHAPVRRSALLAYNRQPLGTQASPSNEVMNADIGTSVAATQGDDDDSD